MEIHKYKYKVGLFFDMAAYLMTYPWITFFSLFCACYWSTTKERSQPFLKTFHYVVCGPILGVLVALLFPVFLSGYILWIIVCYGFEHTNFMIINFASKEKPKSKSVFTFGTGNLLLGVEIMGKFQNMDLVYKRALNIANRLVDRSGNEPLNNCKVLEDKEVEPEVHLKSAVSSDFPEVDFFCFQEVWDRLFAGILIQKLKKKYNHFIMDISIQNLTTQICMGSSGLMVASKYPFLDVHFYKFQVKGRKTWMKLLDYGCVMAKMDLGMSSDGYRKVGFVANLHMMAYQGKQNLVGKAMTEVQDEFLIFRKRNAKNNEKTAFAVISGDFNIDNISPADAIMRDHLLFTQYIDYPMKFPGQDKSWSVGTELRQLRIYDDELSSPSEMRKMMVDNVARRHFIIDADVKEQTMDLMYCNPEPDEDGEVKENPEMGGRRRIDRILYDASLKSKPVGYRFVTALAGQTDHVPVVLSISTST